MGMLSLEKDELVLWAGWGAPLREDICLLTQWDHKKIPRHKAQGHSSLKTNLPASESCHGMSSPASLDFSQGPSQAWQGGFTFLGASYGP